MAAARRGKSLSDAENEKIREVIRKKLLPMFDDNQTAAGKAVGMSQSGLSRLLNGGGAGMETARQISKVTGLPLNEVLGWQVKEVKTGATPRFGNLPGWFEAEQEAIALSGDAIPRFAYRRAAATMGGAPPGVINAATVMALAKFWLQSASKEERIAAELEEILEQRDKEDEDAKSSETRPVSGSQGVVRRPKLS